MKCSNCYAENEVWAAVCVMCGDPVVPVELCVNGHILPPGSRECPLCPSMWPEVEEYNGSPVLRGALWVERGVIVEPDGEEVTFLELRDAHDPICLARPSAGQLGRVPIDSKEAVARIVTRPDGVRICLKSQKRGSKTVYEPLKPDAPLSIDGVEVRLIDFVVPPWAGEDAPIGETRSGRR